MGRAEARRAEARQVRCHLAACVGPAVTSPFKACAASLDEKHIATRLINVQEPSLNEALEPSFWSQTSRGDVAP